MNENDDTPKPATDIDAIIYASGLTRPDAERNLVALESVGWEVKPRRESVAVKKEGATLYERATRDFWDMQTALCRIIQMDITFGTGFVCPRCGREAHEKRTTGGFWTALAAAAEVNRQVERLDIRGGDIVSDTCGHRWRVEPGQRRGVDRRDYDDWPWQDSSA